MSNKIKIISLLLLILAVAVFFRFWQLDAVPPGLYPDVAINGNDALAALKSGEFKLFYPENNGREGLFINLIALSFWLFGASVWAIKIVPATIGVLTVLGMYLMTRRMFANVIARSERSERRSNPADSGNSTGLLRRPDVTSGLLAMTSGEIIALLSSFFLAISFWHVNFSRIGFRAIMVPFFLVWSFYFLWHGLNTDKKYGLGTDDTNNKGSVSFERKPAREAQDWSGWSRTKSSPLLHFILAGIFFGLGFHTYIAFRVAPLILLPVLFFAFVNYWPQFKYWLKNRSTLGGFFKFVYIKGGWWRWDVFFVFVILAALPIATYYLQHPADFLGRTGQVSVFVDPNPLKALAISKIKTLGQFVVWGDTNWRHNLVGSPQIFWPLIPVFLLGLIYSLAQITRKQNYRLQNLSVITTHWTLIVWWGAMLLPAILTNEGLPHALRTIGTIPPSYVFVGLGAYLAIKFLRSSIKNPKLLRTSYFMLLTLAIILVAVEYWRYFIYWGRHPETRSAFTQRFADQARYLNSLPASTEKFVLVNESGVPVPYPDGLPMPAQTIIFLTQGKSKIKYLKPDPNSNTAVPQSEPTIFLPLSPDQNLFAELQKIYPAGQIEKVNDFEVFKIRF